MNWYKKFCKLATRNKWEMLSLNIGEEISKYIKDNVASFHDNALTPCSLISNGIEIKLNITVVNESKKRPINISGGTDKNDGKLIIYISLNKTYFSPEYFNLLWKKVILAVRHEIEHVYYFRELKRQNKTFVRGYDPQKFINPANLTEYFHEKINYLSQDYEREAFIKALKIDAVRTKSSFVKSVKSFVHEQLFSNDKLRENIIKQEVGSNFAIETEQNIIKQYMMNALRIYPQLFKSKYISDLEKEEYNVDTSKAIRT